MSKGDPHREESVREVRWERMFPDELEKAYEKCPAVYLPYGLCEPHGPQNAVGLDALKAHGICCRTAREHGGIVAPPDYWHIHEIGGYASWAHKAVGQVQRSWMTCVPSWIHFKHICYQVRQIDQLGFHAAILLTGHYGPNWQDLVKLMELIQPYVGARLYGLPDFQANQPGFDNDGNSGGDHAGRVETSLLWAVEPDCVDVSRMPPEDEPGPHFAMGANACESDRRTGQRMVDDEVRWLGQKARELLKEFDRLKPEHRLTTFEEVEVMWDKAVKPHLGEFKTMSKDFWGSEPVPEDSVWFKNSGMPDGVV